jgi:O-acetylserine/cysteine efflux transporter
VLLAPVVAMASAAALLGQIPTPAEIGGGVLLVGGVLVTGLPGRRVTQRTASGRGRIDSIH